MTNPCWEGTTKHRMPLVAGLLLSSISARTTVAFFVAISVVLALWGTLSPSIRRAPSLDDLEMR